MNVNKRSFSTNKLLIGGLIIALALGFKYLESDKRRS